LLSFDDPDIAPRLVTFEFDGASAKATGFNGTVARNAFTLAYGRFRRVG
jgi:hypothetical protein